MSPVKPNIHFVDAASLQNAFLYNRYKSSRPPCRLYGMDIRYWSTRSIFAIAQRWREILRQHLQDARRNLSDCTQPWENPRAICRNKKRFPSESRGMGSVPWVNTCDTRWNHPINCYARSIEWSALCTVRFFLLILVGDDDVGRRQCLGTGNCSIKMNFWATKSTY